MTQKLCCILFTLLSTIVFAGDFTTVEGVEHVPTSWGDGDSFRVRFPDGAEHTVRLYGADTLEDTIRTKGQRDLGVYGLGRAVR
ncbi:MAG: hypothetical protein LAT79_01780 [Kiritimatiellae bacterium]|nr:hypothetical protein [Kiritimatiellia bacterium]